MNPLVKFWNACPLDRPPYIHPADKAAVSRNFERWFDEEVRSPQEFVASERFGDFQDNRFHLSTMPTPYVGNLAKADIFVLLLNPGFSFSNYQEEADSESAGMVRRTIRQDFKGIGFPFKSLNPDFAWTGGYRWWEGKLRNVIVQHAVEREQSYLASLQELSRRLACIELVAYRSAKFDGGPIIDQLPSSAMARDYVKSVLEPRARAGDIKIIVTRKVKEWGLAKNRNVILYEGGLTRGAPMGSKTPGGEAILAQLRNPR